MVYYFTYFLTKFLSFLLAPRQAEGRRNIPLKGAFVLASNHISNLDPPLLGISTTRRLHYMAKAELFKHPFWGWWLRELWAFPIKRGEADFGALKQALAILKKGEPVLLFPQGTRAIHGKEDKPLPGAGFLVQKARVPVVPVYVSGSDKAMPPGSKRIYRHKVKVIFGESFIVPYHLSYEEASQYILKRIQALAP